MRLSLLQLAFFAVACGSALPYVEVTPGHYRIDDASTFDPAAWGPKLCGAGTRFSYDTRRVMKESPTVTTYATEGTLVCDPLARR